MKKNSIVATKKWVYWVSIGTVLILIYKFLDNFSGIGSWTANLLSVLAPFVAAILFAYILYKPCAKIEQTLKKKTKHPRGVSVFIVYVITAVLLFFILHFIIPALFESVLDLVNNIQGYYNRINTNDIELTWAPFIQDNVIKPIVDYIQSINFKAIITPDKIWEYVSSAIGILKFLINCFIAIVCSIYILLERESIVKFIDKLAKASMNETGYRKFSRYFSSGNIIFFDFISSQMLDALVVAILMSIIMLILNVKYAVLLGVMIGIFNLIPYFGAIVAVIVASIITVLTGGWEQALIMATITVIIQQIDANIINPRITGSKLNVSPLLVIFAVTLGGAYWGVVGMFIAVPIAVLIKLMITDFVNNKNKSGDM